MDYALYAEQWRCYNVKHPCYFEGIHSRAIQGCSGHQEFCNFFHFAFDFTHTKKKKKKLIQNKDNLCFQMIPIQNQK